MSICKKIINQGFKSSTVSPTFNLTASPDDNRRGKMSISPQTPLINRKLNSKSIDIEKTQYKLELGMDHNILRAMAFADKQAEALKDNSSLTHGFKRMSAGMRILGDYHAKDSLLGMIKEHIQPLKSKVNGKLRNSMMSQNKWISTDRNRWIKTRGLEVSFHESASFLQFLRDLFDALDEDESGRLSADELILPLLAYGLCPDSYYFETALKVIFNCKDTSKIILDKDSFTNMFKEDSRTDNLLKNLDIHTKNMKKECGFSKKTNYRCESAPLQNFRGENEEGVMKYVYPKVEEFINLVKMWWAEMGPIKECVHISKVADFLAERSIFSNKHEGMRIVQEICNQSTIRYEEYEKIFLKAIFKASLLNLAAGLNNGELETNDASLRLKLSSYQRFLMLKGTDPDHESKLGRTTLQAICKYQNSQPDMSRLRVSKDIRNTIKAAENQHKERIKAYLYKLNTCAKEFVNEKGEITTTAKNTWDIRDFVDLKYSKRVSTMLEEEKTFDEAKYIEKLVKPKRVKLNQVPLPRKIKAFRENYMLEKYQKIVVSPLNAKENLEFGK
ncbi:hypothetical protein SteCoe_23249 [Stentor coeruleus]|uniref:EF-hand domain-containing protein n=1 Tax=Stentor coeruleus TaxID=5963 RepID=A0A1R2BKA8_9CILI|nr:hypothetical protein SteCoe_23249 [Stentor coeruleus]